MMRPISVMAARGPAAPPVVTLLRDAATGAATLTWTDGTPVTTDVATWGDPANEIGFLVERAAFKNGKVAEPYAQVGSTLANVTSFTDATALLGTDYSYRIVAFNAAGSTVSAPASGVVETVPAAPTDAVAILEPGPQVRITWRDNSRNEAFFLVERSEDGQAFRLIAQLGANAASHVDPAVSTGRSYQYRVAAANSGGTSPYATTAAVTPIAPPLAPSGLTGTATVSGKKANIALQWVDGSIDESGFELQRATNASFTVGLNTATVAANTVSTTQTGLYRGVTYFYRIRAVNAGGASAWSSVFSIVTP